MEVKRKEEGTMLQRMSEEPSIEPQVQPDNPIEKSTIGKNLSTTHQYSTRSKDKSDNESQSLLKQIQSSVIVQPRLKPVPYKTQDLITEPKISTMPLTDKFHGLIFNQLEDHPLNKRGFKYKPCRPNPQFPSNLYSTTDLRPFTVRPSHFDRSQGILFSEDVSVVTSLHGWQSARANVGIREGKYYMEFNVINSGKGKGHVRIGIARREASLEAPVGFDGYGYGLRDVGGQKITLSRPKSFMQDDGFSSGDVIGLLVELPSIEEHKTAVSEFMRANQLNKDAGKSDDKALGRKRKKAKIETKSHDSAKYNVNDNISRDQIPIRYKNALFYEQFEYTSIKIMEHLLNPVTVFGEKAILENTTNQDSWSIPRIPNSRIIIFKNGIEVGTMFENLYSFLPTYIDGEDDEVFHNTNQQQNLNYRNTDDGSLGYFPMLSAFGGGIVGLNSGPNFAYSLKNMEGVKPLSHAYNDHVVSEWYWDLVDEIEAEYLDSFEA